jgi:hypothetical protein
MAVKKKRGINPKSLANLRPRKVGDPPLNPTGINRKRPFTDRLQVHSEILLGKSEYGEKLRVKLALPQNATWADAAIAELMRRAASGDLQSIREVIDRIEGKPSIYEEKDGDSKEAHVYLVVGDDKRVDQARTVTGSVEITGGDDGRPNHKP